jgi:flagellar protein FlaG
LLSGEEKIVSHIASTTPPNGLVEAGSGAVRGENEGKSTEITLKNPVPAQREEPETDSHEINLGDAVVAFDVDFQSKDVVIKIVDKESREVIREIPAEAMRKVARMLTDAAGQLLDKKV